jgi:type I restriction enzyme S subunit
MSSLYFLYYLRSIEHDWERKSTGTTFSAITGSVLRNQEVPLAPLPEQRRIVDAIETQFTRLDAAVTALERAQANLARYRASVLQAAVEGRLVPTEAALARREGRDYEPADVLLDRILEARRAKWEEERWAYEIERAKKKAAQAERKAGGLPYYIRDLPEKSWIDRTEEEYAPYLPKGDTWKEKYDEPEPPDTEKLPELPEGWVWINIQQLADVQTGATPLRSNDAYYEEGTIPWVKSGAVNRAFVDKAEEYITPLALEETSVKLFPVGSLLVAMYGEGRTRGKVTELRIEATTNQACAGLIFNGTAALCKPFVKIFFMENYDKIRRESSGGVQPNLNLTKIRTTALPLPPLAEQHRIIVEAEWLLSMVEELEGTIEANLTRAERLRQAILKRAFEGRLVEQDPDDEPASALLARIQDPHEEPKQLELL